MAEEKIYKTIKEDILNAYLKEIGAYKKIDKVRKHPADIKVKFRSGRIWTIQVKTSKNRISKHKKKKEIGRLKQSATRTGATAVIAKVDSKGIIYESARNGRKLSPPI